MLITFLISVAQLLVRALHAADRPVAVHPVAVLPVAVLRDREAVLHEVALVAARLSPMVETSVLAPVHILALVRAQEALAPRMETEHKRTEELSQLSYTFSIITQFVVSFIFATAHFGIEIALFDFHVIWLSI